VTLSRVPVTKVYAPLEVLSVTLRAGAAAGGPLPLPGSDRRSPPGVAGVGHAAHAVGQAVDVAPGIGPASSGPSRFSGPP
jgi:hypothetical protein